MHALYKLRNQCGGSLIMGMIAMAALGAGAMVIGEMFAKSDKVLIKDAQTQAYRHLVESVRRNLYAGSNCTQALGVYGTASGKSVAGAMAMASFANAQGAAGEEIPEIRLKLGKEEIVFSKPSLMNDLKEQNLELKTGTSIKNIWVQMIKPGRSNDDIRLHPSVGAPTLKAGYFQIIIEPGHKGINIWNRIPETDIYTNEALFIKIYAYYHPVSKEIYSCFDPASDATFCTEVRQGAYNPDPSVPAELRCQPDNACFQYKGGILPAGTPCPAPYTSSAIGGGAGNSAPLQVCQWCHPIPDPSSIVGPTVNLTANAGDFEGMTCGSTGVTGSDPTHLEWFHAQNDGWIDFSQLSPDQSGSEVAGLYQDAQNCVDNTVSCKDDPNLPPDGNPQTRPTPPATNFQPNLEGGSDGNFCIHDCNKSLKTNTAGGCYEGKPCKFDDGATKCIDECMLSLDLSAAKKTNHSMGCNNGLDCTPDNLGTPCVNECTGATNSVYKDCDDICTTTVNECPPPPPTTAPSAPSAPADSTTTTIAPADSTTTTIAPADSTTTTTAPVDSTIVTPQADSAFTAPETF